MTLYDLSLVVSSCYDCIISHRSRFLMLLNTRYYYIFMISIIMMIIIVIIIIDSNPLTIIINHDHCIIHYYHCIISEKLSLYNPQAKLHIPESLFSGILHDLNHDYNYEKYKNKHITIINKESISSSSSLSSHSSSSSSQPPSSSSHSSPPSLKKYHESNISYIPYQSAGPKVIKISMKVYIAYTQYMHN